MSDPKSPPLTSRDNSPPAGWGGTMRWEIRTAAWRKEPRKHKRAAPGPRLGQDPVLKVLGQFPAKSYISEPVVLAYSNGACFLPLAERRPRVSVGHAPEFLEEGYWVYEGYAGFNAHRPKFLSRDPAVAREWIGQHVSTARMTAFAKLDKIEAIALKAAEALP